MKAILLSAGRGSRLLPLTESRPKCLLPVQGTTLLGYQLDTLEAAGPFFNPFFQVADNLASCWMVRERMDDDFLLINGDTLFALDLIQKVIAAPPAPITVTIDQKPAYDLDDMKVTLSGSTLRAIGKTLSASETDAESIGILRFMGQGPEIFRSKLEQMMRTQDGVQAWFLKAINAIANTEDCVETVLIKGHRWAEVDTVSDFEGLQKNGF
ncbi:MAG: nucleotidyltransferase [Hyphomonas sp. 32-62-5]|nr:MAG: nucleotidyltransferase [Hyphomonas sp. 32-62-5]